ncbi:MAG: thiamine pyrophosphate-dependent enzyme [Candidatus Bathyarchaeota archaeon]|nr:thiamine pyrophosphate-dependent enzyme [Candidatus Bathyarchaeota archaeon]
MMKTLFEYRDQYVRSQPSAFCPGCGGGIILNCFLRAIDDLGLDQDKILAVSGIGCTAWIPSPNFNGDTLHTTHGRAIAFATGAKAFNPDLTTVVFTGDGDGAGIGGNHLIHAARRNINLKVILVNNMSYAMTGGQIAPTTMHGETTVTSPYGNPEFPFDITQLVKAAGASYVAKWSTYHVIELTNAIKEALQHKGFGFIEVLSQCPTQQRRIFNLRGPLDSLPPRILDMFMESTYNRNRESKGGYLYAVPASNPKKTLDMVSGLGSAKIVDHMGFGQVVRVDNPDTDELRGKLEALGEVKYVADHMEKKIELGLFEKYERPELTDSLQEIIRKARGEQ